MANEIKNERALTDLLSHDQLAAHYKVRKETIRRWSRDYVIFKEGSGEYCFDVHCCDESLRRQRHQFRFHEPSKEDEKYLKSFKQSMAYRLESHLVNDACYDLKSRGIDYATEVHVGGGMRADIVGKDWVCEAKVNTDSSSIMLGMAQAMTYKRLLNKRFACLLIPADCKIKDFHIQQCEHNGIEVVNHLDFDFWIEVHDDIDYWQK